MEGYLYESFTSESGEFEKNFTDFLNTKLRDHWKVKSCTYCHDATAGRTSAGCIFKRKE